MTDAEKLLIEYEQRKQDLSLAATVLNDAQNDFDAAVTAERTAKKNLKFAVRNRAMVYKGHIYFCESTMDDIKVLPLINNVE